MNPTALPWSRACLLASLVALAACDGDDLTYPGNPLQAVADAASYGIWSPAGTDTCTAAIHDQYSTVGPDSLRYPTWHPPVDPASGCTFGHEHGRDPSGSDLFDEVGAIPFGYANQHLAESGFGAGRSEDHFGHKVEWENDLEMNIGDGGGAALVVTCDMLTKLHQGTHAPDAFTNNMHEVAYHIRCSDGTGFSATLLTPIGDAGELVASCDRERHVAVGVAVPPNSPDGGGKRAIPDATCVDDRIRPDDGSRPRFDSALRESWEVSASLRRASGRTLASFNPYYQVMDPSRYYDPSADRSMARPIDLCYEQGLVGHDRCEGLPAEVITWDDPRSPFKGVRRFVDINSNNVRNTDGPLVWYTDPLGRNGRTEPFPGSIRQWVAQRDNSGINLGGIVIGRDRDYDAPGVRAPN
jgi:hypothetical protein